MSQSSVESLLVIQLGLIQAAFDMSTPSANTPPKQTGKTLAIVKVLTKFTTNLKTRLKNHPESAAALNMVLDHIKTVSPGQIAALDWSKAFELFDQTHSANIQQAAIQPKKTAATNRAIATSLSQGKKPDAGVVFGSHDVEVATAAMLGLKLCSEYLQSGNSLTVMLPMGETEEESDQMLDVNAANDLPARVPNAIVNARCKAIAIDSSPVRMAAEAIFAVGMAHGCQEAIESNPDMDVNATDMVLHMAELVLADLHDGLDSVDIPTPQDVSLILGIPLDTGEDTEEKSQKIEAICYSVDQFLEKFVQLDTSSLEAFESSLEELIEQAKEIDGQLKEIGQTTEPTETEPT